MCCGLTTPRDPVSRTCMPSLNRDTDLELKPKVLDPKKILAQQQGVLGSKFQSAGGTRHFL